jgi:predicted RNA-binding Zn ribbon-like protein
MGQALHCPGRLKHNFQLVAGHLALDFANTLDWRFDPERRVDLIPSYERFLQFVMQSGVISVNDVKTLLTRTSKRESFRTLQRAVDLRETLDRLFRSIALGSSPSRSCLAKFNHFLADSRAPGFIIRRGSEFVCVPPDFSTTSDGPLWPIVDTAASLLTSPDRVHIRECGEPTCRWLFLDHSKNQSRQWCSMKICGNRAKVERFRARRSG